MMFPHLVPTKSYVIQPSSLVMESEEIDRRKWEREMLRRSRDRYERMMRRGWEVELGNVMKGMDVW